MSAQGLNLAEQEQRMKWNLQENLKLSRLVGREVFHEVERKKMKCRVWTRYSNYRTTKSMHACKPKDPASQKQGLIETQTRSGNKVQLLKQCEETKSSQRFTKRLKRLLTTERGSHKAFSLLSLLTAWF